MRCDLDDVYCSVPAGAPETLLCDLGCPVTEDMSYWERLEILGDDSYGYEDGLSGQPFTLITMTLVIMRNGVTELY